MISINTNMKYTSGKFSILLDWIPSECNMPELRWTAANIQIICGYGQIATRINDQESQTVSNTVRLSAYPLALWFVTNWWRIICEPVHGKLNADWRMSHLLAGAGHGYIWPNLAFFSDGKAVDILCHQSPSGCSDSAVYLNSFHEQIELCQYEETITSFVRKVLSRLEACDCKATHLHDLWNELSIERKDMELDRYRRLEALMGFDPDEAPMGVVDELMSLSEETGGEAIKEIAPLCFGADPIDVISDIKELSASPGVDAQLNIPTDLSNFWINASHSFPSVSQSVELARKAREIFSVSKDNVSNDLLGEIFGVQVQVIQDYPSHSSEQRISLAKRKGDTNNIKLFLRSRWATGRRFEAARFIADSVIAPPSDHWLVSTEHKTVRQKIQRAFAAEFLVPTGQLINFIGDDFSATAQEDASRHFDVSPLVIANQLANNGYITREFAGAGFETIWGPLQNPTLR